MGLHHYSGAGEYGYTGLGAETARMFLFMPQAILPFQVTGP